MKTMSPNREGSLVLAPPWEVRTRRSRTRTLPVPDPAARSVTAIRALAREGVAGVRPIFQRLHETRRDQRQGHPDCVTGLQAPQTLLNGRITASRRFAAQSYSTARVKTIARKHGATSNDVILAMCGSALRKYLQDRNALPATPLIAAVPVSTRRDDGTSGNEVAFALSHLGTHIADPVERLRSIKSCMDYNKRALKSLNGGQLLAYEGMLFAPGVFSLLTGLGRERTIVNVVISHVPGPRTDLYWQGCRLEGLYPVSMIINRIALNITLVSRRDTIDVGLIGCRKTVPHMQYLLTYIEEALNELDPP